MGATSDPFCVVTDANWITGSNEVKSHVIMYSYLVEEEPLGSRLNKYVLLVPQWNLNSLLWIRLMKKLNDSKIS